MQVLPSITLRTGSPPSGFQIPHDPSPCTTSCYGTKNIPFHWCQTRLSCTLRSVAFTGKQEAQWPPVVRGTCMKSKLLICDICEGGLGTARARRLVGDSASGSPEGSRWVHTFGLPVKSLSSLGQRTETCPQLYSKSSWAPSNIWVWISASFPIGCWVEPLRGYLC